MLGQSQRYSHTIDGFTNKGCAYQAMDELVELLDTLHISERSRPKSKDGLYVDRDVRMYDFLERSNDFKPFDELYHTRSCSADEKFDSSNTDRSTSAFYAITDAEPLKCYHTERNVAEISATEQTCSEVTDQIAIRPNLQGSETNKYF